MVITFHLLFLWGIPTSLSFKTIPGSFIVLNPGCNLKISFDFNWVSGDIFFTLSLYFHSKGILNFFLMKIIR